ncbi:MAG: universal stress protein [Planctomycetota bacterium]
MKIDRILFPTDLSDSSLAALESACTLAERFGAELHLLYVLEDLPTVPVMSFEHLPAVTSEQFYEESEKRAADSLREVLHRRVPAEVQGGFVVRRGNPFLEILLAAEEQQIDLIVMSTHGRTGIKHALLGSVTEKVVRKAPCPVLTVREARE